MPSKALVASSMSRGDYNTMKELTSFVLKVGLVTGGALAVILGASYGYLANLFTDNSAVLQIVKSGTLMLVGAISSVVLIYAPSVFGLSGVWFRLTPFMGLRMAAGLYRIRSRNGPWWFYHQDTQESHQVAVRRKLMLRSIWNTRPLSFVLGFVVFTAGLLSVHFFRWHSLYIWLRQTSYAAGWRTQW